MPIRPYIPPGWKTSRTIEVVILFITILQYTSVESSECPTSFTQSVNCLCTRIGLKQYDLLCPKNLISHNSYNLRADVEENNYASISCSDIKSPADLTAIYGLNVGPVDAFKIKLCPLPDTSFRELMLSMGIKQIKSLHIQMVSNNSELERKHLEGLNEVTEMDLALVGLREPPEDLFKDMSNLKALKINNNNINHLPKGIFKYLPKLDVLDLGNNNITYLKPGIFRNLSQLRLLNLWNNKISNLTRAVFSDTPNLVSLDLRSNSLVLLTPDLFTDLVNLKHVNLLGNKIAALPHGLFSSNPLLETFTLIYNRNSLNTIPQGLLSNISHLKEVNLHNCNISVIPKDLIWNSPTVTKISLKGNLLKELPEELFRDSRELAIIDISQNRLKSLSNSTFVATKKLKVLTANHNQLTHISRNQELLLIQEQLLRQWSHEIELLVHLSDLDTVDFSNNNLRKIDDEAFFGNPHLRTAIFSNNFLELNNFSPLAITNIFGPESPFKKCNTLEKLYLANNSITQIFSDWQQASLLKFLDLRYNKISYVEARDLHFRSKEKLEVDLSNNNISVIDLSFMEALALAQYADEIKPHYQNPLENHSTRINIEENPLQCDCRNYHLKQYFDNQLTPEVNYIIELESYNLTCAGPSQLKGLMFKIVPSKLFMCPIDKVIEESQSNSTCPDQCDCFYRPIDKGLIIDCSKRNIMTIPENFLSSTLVVYKKLNYKYHNINYTELDLSENYITSLPKNLDDGFKYVTKLTLSSNNITQINAYQLSPNIAELKLDNNNISYLDSESIKFLSEANQLSSISLKDNPWQCDCKSRELLNFIQNYYEKIDMLANVTCIGGKSLYQLTVNDVCPFSSFAANAVFIIMAILGCIFGLVCFIYYKYNQEIKVWLYAHQLCLWFVTEDEIDRDKQYDAFISYSHKDEEFVIRNVVPGLENGPPDFKLCLHYRDWVVGDYIPTQIARSVENSRRTIVILSPNFLDSVWGKMEFRTAHLQALKEGRARVIVILYGDIGSTDNLDPELKAYISMNTYIKWGDPWFWDRLRFALPHPPKMSKGIPLFQRNIARQQNRPGLYIDKDDLIKENDPNATPPATTTPPANSFISQTPSFIPNGQTKSVDSSSNDCAKIKY